MTESVYKVEGVHAEVIRLLHVEDDGRVRPTLHVVAYFADRPGRRALYTGTADHLSFDRWESRNEPGETTWITREWDGNRAFRAPKVGDAARRVVEFERKRVAQCIQDGHWLTESYAVAKREARRAQAWADAHVRALAAKPAEDFGKSSPLYACVASVENAASEIGEQQYRLRVLSSSIAMLRDTRTLGEDD